MKEICIVSKDNFYNYFITQFSRGNARGIHLVYKTIHQFLLCTKGGLDRSPRRKIDWGKICGTQMARASEFKMVSVI